MSHRFSLAITHTPWVPERVEPMKRLYADLFAEDGDYVVYKCFNEKAPYWVWSEKMWDWSASKEVDWCIFLQDDAEVSPNFFKRLESIIADTACEVIGLQVAHPIATHYAAEGHMGFTTTDGIVGVGYAIKRRALDHFLVWRAGLAQEALEAITEDSLVGIWCSITGHKVYHPLPTIVDHDTSVPTTYAELGNATHANRRSLVRWDSGYIPSHMTVQHVGCFYEATPHIAKAWCGIDNDTFTRILADSGHRELRRLNFARRAKGVEAKASVFIATPTRGGVSPNYASTIWRILRDEEIDVEASLEVLDVQQWGEDLVRVRSRFVSYFLNQTSATHLLFLDSDIEMLPKTLRGMLASTKDFVACPYPKRDSIDFARVRATSSEIPSEAVAYRYSVRLLNDALSVEPGGCADVEAMPLGCALLTRAMCQAMSEEYNELGFDDVGHGPSVALFQLVLENRNLLSEDYSFCKRYRSMGGHVYMYLGDGSPVNHMGEHRYVGNVESFGLRRSVK